MANKPQSNHYPNCGVFIDGACDCRELQDLQESDSESQAMNNIDEAALKAERRVVCAAIRAADGEVLLGIRHYSPDMHRQIDARRDGAKFKHRHDEDQGFVDQWGVFMSREEGYALAERNGQITRPHACGEGLNGKKLYSEGLY